MKNDDEVLIDSKDRVFKNFKDTIRQRQYGYEEPIVYILEDGSRYDGNGRRLSGEEPTN